MHSAFSIGFPEPIQKIPNAYNTYLFVDKKQSVGIYFLNCIVKNISVVKLPEFADFHFFLLQLLRL